MKKDTNHATKALLALFTMLMPLLASAHDFEVNSIYYNITSEADKTVEMTFKGVDPYSYWDEYSGSINIPATVTYNGVTYSVMSIGYGAFQNCSSLTAITLPESVTSIGGYAFEACNSLTAITLPESVASIGYGAFQNCSSLTAINIPKSVTTIEEAAFSGCSSLTAINIPENSKLTSIGDRAFEICCSLTAIIIPKGVTSIGVEAFEGCSSLTAMVVVESNTKYDSRNNCNAIIETSSNTLIHGCSATIIPESVTSIGEWAFIRCSSLTAINIPESVMSIGGGAFLGCSSLTTISIPEGVTSIRYSTFEGCNSLTEITIPEGVTNIERYAFLGCSSLTTINIPESVTSIATRAFDGYSLTTITVADGNNTYDSRSGCNAIIETCSNTLIQGCATSIIPEGVTGIGNYAFAACNSLTAVNIPEGMTSIGNYAFYDCSSLTAITLPTSLTSIGWYAFYRCWSLTTITCEGSTPPTIGDSHTFSQVAKSIPVYVPAGSVEAYKAAEYWSEFTNIQPLSNGYILTVSSAGYATLFLDYAAKIPDNVKAYIGTRVEGNRLMMTQVTGVLPANTGVIVRAEAGKYTFEESKDMPANVEGNLLSGTATDTYITAESDYKYYVLAQKDGLVAMYRPILTDGRFLNNANKAYIALDTNRLGIYDDEVNTDEEGGQLSNSLRFDFGGTTTIENLQFIIDNSQIIYDLHGRRITDTEGLKGIYIMNGRKVVI